jgi:hypothetical protein
VDEVVDCLERVFADRTDALARARIAADMMSQLTWKRTAEELKALLLGL